MQPSLSPGDTLELDLDPARRASAGPGDIVVFLDADASLTAHRVLARWRKTLLTKGDARLLPDPLLPTAAVVGVATAVLNRGRRRPLDNRAAGLAAAVVGALLVVCRRLTQLAAWPARRVLLAVWSAAETAARASLWTAAPAAARALAAALSRAETAPEALRVRLSAALRRIWERPGTEEPAPAAGSRSAGGMLAADETWSGDVRLFGDVVIPRGVTLTVAAGARVAAKDPKRWHHGASRRAEGAAREADPRRPRLAVYGRLIVAGRAEAPVSFTGDWEGIALYGGKLEARSMNLTGAARGVSARDGARALLRDCVFELCGTAVEVAGGSTLGISETRIINCAGGLAADGGTSLLRGVSLTACRRAGALLSAGTHALEDCAFSGGPTGLEASGTASVRLTRSSFEDAAGPAVALAGSARAVLADARVARCAAGLELAEDANLEGENLVIESVAGHGLCLQDRARLSASRVNLSGCGENGVYLQDQTALDLIDGRISDCAGGLAADGGSSLLRRMRLSGGRNLNADMSAGRHAFEDCTFERAPRGLSVRMEAQVELTRVHLSGHELAACVAGRSKLTARYCRWTGNKTGLWIQEEGGAELSACRFAGHAEPALRLGQRANARLARCLFLGDWMAVFAEDASSLEATRCLLRRTPTGVKLEGRSRARLCECRFSNCALDGLWVGAEAWTRAEDCVFSRCRVGLHAHVSARVEWPGSSFRLNAGDDRRAFDFPP